MKNPILIDFRNKFTAEEIKEFRNLPEFDEYKEKFSKIYHEECDKVNAIAREGDTEWAMIEIAHATAVLVATVATLVAVRKLSVTEGFTMSNQLADIIALILHQFYASEILAKKLKEKEAQVQELNNLL